MEEFCLLAYINIYAISQGADYIIADYQNKRRVPHVVGAAFMTPVRAHEAVGKTGVMNAVPTTSFILE